MSPTAMLERTMSLSVQRGSDSHCDVHLPRCELETNLLDLN